MPRIGQATSVCGERKFNMRNESSSLVDENNDTR